MASQLAAKESECSAAIVEMLSAKRKVGEWMPMLDNTFGGVNHPNPVAKATVAEIAVLGGSERLVESSDHKEKFTRYRQVVRCKEKGLIRPHIVIAVYNINYDLAHC